MAVYTLFGQASPGGAALVADANPYTLGVQFQVSQPLPLTAIWWYSASGATVLPQTIALFQVSGHTLVTSQSASWSGAAGSGWVRAAFTSPPALAAGTAYEACVLQTTNTSWYSEYGSGVTYWTTGPGSSGITNGPLSAPNAASAVIGQDLFIAGSSLAYPTSTATGVNFNVDPEVTSGVSADARQQAAGLLLLGLPQSPQFFQAPSPPPPVPAPQHAVSLLRIGLQQASPSGPVFQSAATAATVSELTTTAATVGEQTRTSASVA